MTLRKRNETMSSTSKKAPAKKASAKKTPAQKTPAKKTLAKKATPTVSAESDQQSSSPKMIGLAVVALLAGGILGSVLSNSNAPSGDLDAQMEAYIRANPELILTVVRDYSMNKERESFTQAMNMVKADDGQTVFGNPDGDVTIYEFSDYNCGYCKRVFADLQALVEEDGNIRVVVKEFPILSQSSVDAALVSLAAAELGQYGEVHRALMEWQGPLNSDVISQVITDLGLDAEAIKAKIESGDYNTIIANNRGLAETMQITGTPAFIIGDEFAPGAISIENMREMVKKARES